MCVCGGGGGGGEGGLIQVTGSHIVPCVNMAQWSLGLQGINAIDFQIDYAVSKQATQLVASDTVLCRQRMFLPAWLMYRDVFIALMCCRP